MTQPIQTDLAIIGGGPAGYSAAFRAADLGLSVTLIEKHPLLGGVCLRAGCIPSKTVLDLAALLHQAEESAQFGVVFGSPKIDLPQLVKRKEQIIARLARGIAQLAKLRRVQAIQGSARFITPHSLHVSLSGEPSSDRIQEVHFQHAVIATGSLPITPPDLPSDPRILFSKQALTLSEIPSRLTILGAGIVGLEMGMIYRALGSEVTLIESAQQLLPQLPREIVTPLERVLRRRQQHVLTQTTLLSVTPNEASLSLQLKRPNECISHETDALLVAVGRQPNTAHLGIEELPIARSAQGAIITDIEGRSSLPHLFAAGDVTGEPMLAHRAIQNGIQIAEILAGGRKRLTFSAIPSALYTDPEIAWVGEMGLASTQNPDELSDEPIRFLSAQFPWSANGRAASMGRNDGLTRVVVDSETMQLVGAQIVGVHAGELISELSLGIEAGMSADVLLRTIHPHPTLSETIAGACAALYGKSTDLPPR